MEMEEQLRQLFVPLDAIPQQYRLAAELHQKEYLSNGELKIWKGAVHEVYSPICYPTD